MDLVRDANRTPTFEEHKIQIELNQTTPICFENSVLEQSVNHSESEHSSYETDSYDRFELTLQKCDKYSNECSTPRIPIQREQTIDQINVSASIEEIPQPEREVPMREQSSFSPCKKTSGPVRGFHNQGSPPRLGFKEESLLQHSPRRSAVFDAMMSNNDNDALNVSLSHEQMERMKRLKEARREASW